MKNILTIKRIDPSRCPTGRRVFQSMQEQLMIAQDDTCSDISIEGRCIWKSYFFKNREVGVDRTF